MTLDEWLHAKRGYAAWMAHRGAARFRIDRDDAESLAYEALWRGFESYPKEDRRVTRESWCYGCFLGLARNASRDLHTTKKRAASHELAEFARIGADALARRIDLQEQPSKPCLACGTVWGRVRPGYNFPYRLNGKCWECSTPERNVSKHGRRDKRRAAAKAV